MKTHKTEASENGFLQSIYYFIDSQFDEYEAKAAKLLFKKALNHQRHQLLSDIRERVIGENKPIHGWTRPNGNPSIDLTESYRNALRAEQRQVLDTLMKGEK